MLETHVTLSRTQKAALSLNALSSTSEAGLTMVERQAKAGMAGSIGERSHVGNHHAGIVTNTKFW